MSETVTIRPNSTSYPASTGASVTNANNAITSDLSTYATLRCLVTVTSTTLVMSVLDFFCYFNLSAIPEGANVLEAKFYTHAYYGRSNESKTAYTVTLDRKVHLFDDGDSPNNITSKKSFGSSLESPITNEFILTDEEIQNLVSASNPAIRFSISITGKKAKKGSPSRDIYLEYYVYSCWLEVTYELPSGVKNKVKVNGTWVEAEPYVKVNGTWEKATNVFIKVNGNWEEVT